MGIQIEDVKLSGSVKKAKIDWSQLLEKHKWAIGIGLIGLALLVSGFYFYFSSKEEVLVEIIPAEEEVSETIWVDIEGAVEKPGVYELASESRINDLLIKAGGLSASADRDWVELNINLAQKLSDGVKVYFSYQGEDRQISGSSVLGKININTASASELDSLWGIGPKRAADIITSRPFQSVEDLKSKKIIPENVYERIKDEISAY